MRIRLWKRLRALGTVFLNTLGIDTRFCNALYLFGEENPFILAKRFPFVANYPPKWEVLLIWVRKIGK